MFYAMSDDGIFPVQWVKWKAVGYTYTLYTTDSFRARKTAHSSRGKTYAQYHLITKFLTHCDGHSHSPNDATVHKQVPGSLLS